MADVHHPDDKQRRFLEKHILGEDGTILTLKRVHQANRGFSVNIRGPFKLAEYKFPGQPETVIDVSWAKGGPESESHVHCCWGEVLFAKGTKTNDAVQKSIGHDWQLSFFANPDDAKIENPIERSKRSLFWFYLKDHHHKAVQNLKEKEGEVISLKD